MSSIDGNLCQECQKGYLVPRTGVGRTLDLRDGTPFKMPDELPIPTCDNPECGEMSFDDDILKALAHVSQLKD